MCMQNFEGSLCESRLGMMPDKALSDRILLFESIQKRVMIYNSRSMGTALIKILINKVYAHRAFE